MNNIPFSKPLLLRRGIFELLIINFELERSDLTPTERIFDNFRIKDRKQI